jgi:hypothetical protein
MMGRNTSQDEMRRRFEYAHTKRPITSTTMNWRICIVVRCFFHWVIVIMSDAIRALGEELANP